MSDFQDPYVYPGTNLLRNLQDEYSPERAAAAERDFSLLRRRELELRPVNPSRGAANNNSFDLRHLKEIHRRLYQDVWAWAGEIRAVEINKGSSHFHQSERIESAFAGVHDWLVNDTALLSNPKIDDETFIKQAADLLEKVNYIHPFREGNGRTQRAYLDQVASISGRTLSWRNIEPRENIRASIASMQTGSGEPLESLLREALKPPVDGLGLLDEDVYAVSPPASATASRTDTTSPGQLSAEQLRIRKRRFPELLEEQQAQNSATDPDYLTFE